MSDMRYPSADRPVAIKAINVAGRALQTLGIARPRLEVAMLLEQAQADTGLSDFGDPSFREGLTALVDSMNTESRLSQIGRVAAHGLVLESLVTRLKLIECRKQRPEIAEQKIERPLFIMGLPRTGTTILHEILAADPAVRAPLTWEVADPFPPAQAATFASDPRIAASDEKTAKIETLAPGVQSMHKMAALLPQECVALLGSHFISDQFGVPYRVPSYRAWCRQQDMTAAYTWHKQFLQHLQVDYMRERWVLKTPVHQPFIDAILQVYPDALFVQTHRDPMDVMSSVVSLTCTLRGGFSDHIDPQQVALEELEHFSQLLQRGLEQRAARPDLRERFYDISFTDIITDPVAAIEKMYAHFSMPVEAVARDAMQGYIDNRPRDKHGKHRHSLAQFGLSRDAHASYFADYYSAYGALLG